jgi:hypothetical protein
MFLVFIEVFHLSFYTLINAKIKCVKVELGLIKVRKILMQDYAFCRAQANQFE